LILWILLSAVLYASRGDTEIKSCPQIRGFVTTHGKSVPQAFVYGTYIPTREVASLQMSRAQIGDDDFGTAEYDSC
jgi:hypothetical protein